MKYVVWTVQVLIAIAFLAAGSMKLFTPYDEVLLDPNMGWVEEFTPGNILLFGVLEVLGAITLIAGMFIAPLKRLVPIAAGALGAMMIGAAITHLGRGEPIIVNIILMALSFLVAYWRKDMLKAQ